ncbi:MAG: HemK family protein methyltransferase, partial [Clostridia bacterium]|nr:HemK family protein methyltransferase [Clostridia bacterium]
MSSKSLKMLRRELVNLFRENNIESPEAESGLILMHSLGINKTQLITKDIEIQGNLLKRINDMALRRLKGEPSQYIIGTCPFMDLDFYVNTSTLIPRPETELLVELLADKIGKKNKVVWDIGCGSGCIGITLAYICPEIKVYEIDISKEALDTAKKTAIKYELENRVKFVNFDILSGMPDR